MALGVVRPNTSFTMTTPAARPPVPPPKPAAPAAAGAYGGLDPGTISHQPFIDYGNQIMQTAMDPQNALRDREQQRLQERVRAGLESRGLNMSGAGQGIENQAMTDFGLDWQNNQLGRQIQGAGAFNMLGNSAQNIANTGFQNAGQLGASQFTYDPQIMSAVPMQSAPQFSYGGMSSSGGGGGGFSSGFSSPSPFAANRQAASQMAMSGNAAALADKNARQQATMSNLQRALGNPTYATNYTNQASQLYRTPASNLSYFGR